jgi:glycosyltransferase involved in cell wall biosynthesis
MGSGSPAANHDRVIGCLPRGNRVNAAISRIGLALRGWRYGLGSPYQVEQTTFALGLIRALKKGRYDIVHLQDSWLALILERTGKWGWHGAHTIIVNGTEDPVDFLMKFEHVQESSPPYFERHEGTLQGKQWFCIPNFVDAREFHPVDDKQSLRAEFGLRDDDIVVLSVGAINTRKRVDWLISEFGKVDDPSIRLVLRGALAGGEGSEDLVRTALDQLGDRVVVLSELEFSRMPALYATADIFALCSLFEIFGIVWLEAMASGVPCVGHTFPVTEWIIGDTGRCIDMEQPGLLAKTLTELAADPSARATLGEKGRERVNRMFSQEAVTRDIIKMYQDVLRYHGSLES